MQVQGWQDSTIRVITPGKPYLYCYGKNTFYLYLCRNTLKPIEMHEFLPNLLQSFFILVTTKDSHSLINTSEKFLVKTYSIYNLILCFLDFVLERKVGITKKTKKLSRFYRKFHIKFVEGEV